MSVQSVAKNIGSEIVHNSSQLKKKLPTYLYQGLGVNKSLAKEWNNRLSEYSIESICINDPKDFEKIKEKKGVLIFPGGQAGVMATVLEKQINTIQNLVKKGFSFIGGCAGASLACMDASFTTEDIKGPFRASFSELKWPRLQIISAIASHTTFSKITNFEGRVCQVSIANEQPMNVYFNSGCHFITDGYGIEFSGNYIELETKPKAFVQAKQGLGIVMIMGFHPEVSGASVQEIDTKLTKEQINQIVQTDIIRTKFLQDILQKAGALTTY